MELWMSRSVKTLISLVSFLAGSPLLAGSMAGMSVGEPLERARDALGRFGEVKVYNETGAPILMSGDYSITTCAGSVWGITRQMEPSFSSFISLSRKLELEMQSKPRVNLIDDEGRDRLQGVELVWDSTDGTSTAAFYLVGRTGTSLSHSVRSTRLCK